MNRQSVRSAFHALLAACTLLVTASTNAEGPARFSEQAGPVPTASQRLEVQRRGELAKRVVEQVAGDARALGLQPSWRQSMLVTLLAEPASRLATLAGMTSHSAVMNELAKPTPKALGDASNDLVFKPFVPCRYIDTRNAGGKIAGTRQFDLANNGGVYGGIMACDPKTLAGISNEDQIGALAVNIALVDTSAGAPGFLTMRPSGSTQLTALANWYVASVSTQDSNAAVVPIDQTGQTNEIEILTSGAVDVIVDLLGAFLPPNATALDCATVTNPPGGSATGDLAPGQSAIFTATCAAGYTVTGGGCTYFSTAQVSPAATDNKVLLNRSLRPFDQASQTFLNAWTCHFTNTDPSVTWRVQTRTVCCRVPGR
jgi:hypothetical protein